MGLQVIWKWEGQKSNNSVLQISALEMWQIRHRDFHVIIDKTYHGTIRNNILDDMMISYASDNILTVYTSHIPTL